MSICEVIVCKSTGESSRMYHRFPNDPARRKEWIRALGYRNLKIKTTSAICSRHFRTKEYYPGGRRLLSDAVPSLRLWKKVIAEDKLTKNASKNNIKDLKQKTGVSKSNSLTSPKNTMHSKALQASPTIKLPKINMSSSCCIKKNVKSLKGEKSKNNKLSVLAIPSKTSPVKKKVGSLEGEKSKNNNKTGVSGTPSRASSSPQKKNAATPKKPVYKIKQKKKMCTKRKGNRTIVPPKTQKSYPKNDIVDSASCVDSTVFKTCAGSVIKSKQQEELCLTKSFNNTNSILAIETRKCPPKYAALTVSSIESTRHNTRDVKSTNTVDVTNSCDNHSVSAGLKEETVTHTNGLRTKTSRSRKRNFEEISPVVQSPKKRNKRNNQPSPSITSGEASNKQDFDCSNHLQTTTDSSVSNITSIEQRIFEMQNKIHKLEKKSILDEKKIDTFKKALIQQRKNDIQFLIDEKENELLLRMDLLYLDYDPQRICLLCLLLVDKKESLISFVWPSKNQGLISLIKNTLNIQIELDDGMPSGICKECLLQVKRVDWIRRRTQRSNMLIKKFVTMKKGLSDGSTCGSINNTMVEKPQFSDDLFEEEVTEVFKIEDVFSLDDSSEISPFDCMSLKQEPLSDEEVSKTGFNQDQLSAVNIKAYTKKLRKCKRCCTDFTNYWSWKNHFKYCKKIFQCSECSKCFWNSQLFQMHKRRKHTCICEENQRCCFECKVVFRWKWQLIFHVLRHSPHPCELCSEVLYSIDQLKHHFIKTHFSH